jgi:hypothetical protein
MNHTPVVADLIVCADDFVARDATIIGNRIELPFATHAEAMAALRNLRAAISKASQADTGSTGNG